MVEEHTTAVVQRYLDDLGGDAPADSAVRALLDRAVRRLHELCAALLHRSYPRLTRPPSTSRRTNYLARWSSVCSRRCARSARGPSASSSPWLANTCGGNLMKWPAA